MLEQFAPMPEAHDAVDAVHLFVRARARSIVFSLAQ